MLYLVGTTENVDDVLLNTVRGSVEPGARLRALSVLLSRNNRDGLRIAAEWVGNKDVEKRLGGWMCLRKCTDTKLLYRELTPAQMMMLYASESDIQVREQMEYLFGDRKATFAVDSLCKTLTDPRLTRLSPYAALGSIGDPRAVPALIRLQTDSAMVISVLGDIGSPEAIEYLCSHISHPDAPKELAIAGSAKALPALRKRLVELEEMKRTWKLKTKIRITDLPKESIEESLRWTRLAILRLSSENPLDAVMAVAENRKESEEVRKTALILLRRMDTTSVVKRILAVFKSWDSDGARIICIGLLGDKPGEDVTQAFLDRLQESRALSARRRAEDSGLSKTEAHLESLLVDALHKRIGNRIFDLGLLE
jgi:HEAT repeat protein